MKSSFSMFFCLLLAVGEPFFLSQYLCSNGSAEYILGQKKKQKQDTLKISNEPVKVWFYILELAIFFFHFSSCFLVVHKALKQQIASVI